MRWCIRHRPDSTPVSTTASVDGTGTPGRLPPTGRLEAFFDGVLAIVITLLVLELHVADRTGGVGRRTRPWYLTLS